MIADNCLAESYDLHFKCITYLKKKKNWVATATKKYIKGDG